MKTLKFNEDAPEWSTIKLEGYGYYSEQQAKYTGKMFYYIDINNNKTLVTEIFPKITLRSRWEDAVFLGPMKIWHSNA
jgi:hypothetical protein